MGVRGRERVDRPGRVEGHAGRALGRDQRVGNLAGQQDGAVLAEGPVGAQHLGERCAGQQLHDEVSDPVLGSGIEDRDDPGMVQLRGRQGLAMEPGRDRGVGRLRKVDQLDGDVTL